MAPPGDRGPDPVITNLNSNTLQLNTNIPNEQKNDGEMQVADSSKSSNNFYFIEYLNRKNKIKEQFENKNNLIKFKNTIKIITKTTNTQIAAKDIFKGLKEKNENISTETIKSISQSISKKVWFVEFKNESDFKKIENKQIEISNQMYDCLDANSRKNISISLSGVLRFHWLPPFFRAEEVERFLAQKFQNKNINIEKVSKETFKGEMEGIENGKIRAKITFPLEEINTIMNLVGATTIGEDKVSIQLDGFPMKCIYCAKFEHPSKNCPRKYMKCTKCQGKFHESSECNFANVVRQQLVEYDDLIDNFEDQLEENSSTTHKETNQNKVTNDTYIDNNSEINRNNNHAIFNNSNNNNISMASTNSKKKNHETETIKINNLNSINKNNSNKNKKDKIGNVQTNGSIENTTLTSQNTKKTQKQILQIANNNKTLNAANYINSIKTTTTPSTSAKRNSNEISPVDKESDSKLSKTEYNCNYDKLIETISSIENLDFENLLEETENIQY
jgi:hypothetical protein